MKPQTNIFASFFYWLGELSVEPLRFMLNDIIGRWQTVLVPGKFGNARTKTREILIRIVLVPVLVFLIGPVIVTALLWVIFRFIGDLCLGSQPFLLLKGQYTGSGNNTFASWNTASFLPPCTLVDGVEYSHNRTYQIGELIKDFHFVCCQEMGGAEARFLFKQLKDNFAEFYTYLGKSNTPLLQSGLFFASKEHVINAHWFPYSPTVPGVQIPIHRGFAVFELQNYYVVVTHPDSTDSPDLPTVQLGEINLLLKTLQQFQDKPIILCADLNIDRYSKEQAYVALTAKFPDVVGDSCKDCSNCSDLFQHSYCPTTDVSASDTTPCITDTNILAYNRFSKTGPVYCSSIDFFSSNKLKLNLTGTEYHYYLTDHHLMKGEIVSS